MQRKNLRQEDSFKLMRALAFFTMFTDDELLILIAGKSVEMYDAGEPIVTEGDAGCCHFYIILRGGVNVTKRFANSPLVKQLNELRSGDCFGEMAIVTGQPRAASVIANQETAVFSISSDCLAEETSDLVRLSIKYKLMWNFARELAIKLDAYNERAVLLL